MEKKFGIRVHYKAGDTFDGDPSPEDYPAKPINPEELKRLPRLLGGELAKYPPWVIRKYLNRVRFVEDLSNQDGHSFYGLALEEQNSILVSVAEKGAPEPSVDVKDTFHHEFATFLMEIHDFPANEWTKCNPPDFKYKDPEHFGHSFVGKKWEENRKFWPLGFVTYYSQASLDNDFEEFSGLIFSEPYKAKLLIDHFPKLKEKYQVWLKVHRKIDPHFFTEKRFFRAGAVPSKWQQSHTQIFEINGTWFNRANGTRVSGVAVTYRNKAKRPLVEYATHYRDGKMIRENFYYPNGKKEQESLFKNGKEESLTTWWYDNGQKESEARYRNGKVIQSTVKHWKRDGTPK